MYSREQEQDTDRPNIGHLEEANFRQLIEKNADGILIIDRQGVIRYTNLAAEKLLGRSQSDLLGQPFGFPVADSHKAEIDILRHSSLAVAEMQVVEIIWAGLPAYLASLRDITAHKQLENELRQSNQELVQLHKALHDKAQILKETQDRLNLNEKLAAIGKLVAGLAHELNNPLASIVLRAQLLQQNSIGLTIQTDLGEIVAQARRMSQIVHGLLDFSRPQTSEKTAQDLNSVVRQTLAFLNYDLQCHHIRTVMNLGDNLPPVLIDEVKTQQALINIINNAIYFMSSVNGQGTLTLTTEYNRELAGRPPAASAGVVRLTIADDGPGIAETAQSRIFDPFFTTKPVGEGTGLGLSLVHSMVTEQNGQVWFKTRAGRGTQFFIELPAAPQAVVENREMVRGKTAVLPLSSSNSQHILVIEDEPSLLEALTEIFATHNYRVEGIPRADIALSEKEYWRYDLIVSDLMMPGLSGIDFYREATAAHPEINEKFIFITGDIVSSATQHFLHSTGVSYLSKPFSVVALIELAQTKLGQSEE